MFVVDSFKRLIWLCNLFKPKKLYPCSFYTLSGLPYVILIYFVLAIVKDKFILTVLNFLNLSKKRNLDEN
jgi:hypothetical protein